MDITILVWHFPFDRVKRMCCEQMKTADNIKLFCDTLCMFNLPLKRPWDQDHQE